MTVELRAWTAFEEALGVRSGLAVAVHAALTAADIEIAVPRRDVHIRNADESPVGMTARTSAP
jgi:small-conductance mechanosensitive channel